MSSVQGAVSAALGLQNYMLAQEKNNNLLTKVLDNQRDTITQLVDSAIPPATGPQPLAESGAVGTRIHVTA